MSGWKDLWPSERVSLLREHWAAGASVGEIATLLNVSKNAVVGKAHRLGLERRLKQTGRRKKASRRVKQTPPIHGRISSVLDLARIPVPPWNIGPHDCQWPIGNPRKPGFGFCGHPIIEDGYAPYCAEHHARAYTPAEPFKLKAMGT